MGLPVRKGGKGVLEGAMMRGDAGKGEDTHRAAFTVGRCCA